MVMTFLLGLVLLLGELLGGEASAQIISGQRSGGVSIGTGTEVPATCTPGTVNPFFLDTDDQVLYVCTATDTFSSVLSAEADTLNTVFNRGKSITGANSFANAVKFLDSNGDGFAFYTDATDGPIFVCVNNFIENACSSYARTLAANQTVVYKNSAGTAISTLTETGTLTLNSTLIRTNHPIMVQLNPRGAATIGLQSILTNQPGEYYLTLTDSNIDAADFTFLVPPDLAGKTTATFRLVGVSTHATPAGSIDFDCAMQTFTPGTDTYVAHSTAGEVTALLTPAVQNRPVAVTTSVHTINGGALLAGDIVKGSCEVDATATTSTQMTNFRLEGWVLITLN